MKKLVIALSLVMVLLTASAFADVTYVIDGSKLIEIEYNLETIDRGGFTVVSVTEIPGEINLT